jgi:uncharacterized protein (DUF1697 family)
MPTRCAILLRGVNVGKHNRVAMADLRRVLTSLGLEAVTTYLQSGNAVVTGDPSDLAATVEQVLATDLDLPVRVLVRTAAELDAIVAANPFPERAADIPKMVHVAFLEHPADPAVVEAFGLRHGGDEIALGEGVLYFSYATSSFDSPINKVLPRLDGVASTRNWSTVLKLRALTAAG